MNWEQSGQAAEKGITIHEMTRTNTKPHEQAAVLLVLFRGLLV